MIGSHWQKYFQQRNFMLSEISFPYNYTSVGIGVNPEGIIFSRRAL